MRPWTDRLKISREKLAYIVDSTAAPVSAIVFVSTWVGYEISLIGDGDISGAISTAKRDSGIDILLGIGIKTGKRVTVPRK